MPMFKGKDGKSSFHMNPQAGKSLHGGDTPLVKSGKPGEGGTEGENSGEHQFNGENRAHHVEVHHGGHEQGQPPDDGSMTHHTIAHDEMGGQDIRNHASMEEAKDHMGNAMHEGCPDCDPAGDHGEQGGGAFSEGSM